jgi:hypothetical protein
MRDTPVIQADHEVGHAQGLATGDTQAQANDRAKRKYPDDPRLAERVRNTESGSRDKWRRIY